MDKLDLAIRAAKEAGKIHLKYFKSMNIPFKQKNRGDLVTEADIEAEKKIISMIQKVFPEHNILAEESGRNNKKSRYLWVIDPLDGTKNFFRGHRDFSVLIALVDGNDILFGVTLFPLTKELFVAQKGKGATKNGEPLKVSGVREIPRMWASTHMSTRLKNRVLNLKLYERLLAKNMTIDINSCISRLLTDVAEGLTDFHFRKGMYYWDYAAGILLVEEASGKATDLSGIPITCDSEDVFVSNNKSHDELLKLMST